MSRALATLDRLIVFLVALVVGAIGVWSICYFLDLYWAHRVLDFIDWELWKQAPTMPWYKYVLAGMVAVFGILGLIMVLANIRRKRIAQVHSEDASTQDGSIHFNVSDIASAVAGQLERDPKVNKVNDVVLFDRGRPTMQFTVKAQPDIHMASLRSHIDQAERDIRDAIGTADIDTVYRIHLDSVV